MFYKTINFTNSIWIFDEFIKDDELILSLKNEKHINSTIEGQDHFNLSAPQKMLKDLTSKMILNYCIENDIEYNQLHFNNFQKGRLLKYDQTIVDSHLYEPHHDMAECGYLTAIYYVDSSFNETEWVGGELAIYEKLSFVDYPANTVNILPKSNRLVIFPGFLVHRVKPYFGEIPRTSVVMGWGVKDSVKSKRISI